MARCAILISGQGRQGRQPQKMKITWDDEIPKLNGNNWKHIPHVPNHQAVFHDDPQHICLV